MAENRPKIRPGFFRFSRPAERNPVPEMLPDSEPKIGTGIRAVNLFLFINRQIPVPILGPESGLIFGTGFCSPEPKIRPARGRNPGSLWGLALLAWARIPANSGPGSGLEPCRIFSRPKARNIYKLRPPPCTPARPHRLESSEAPKPQSGRTQRRRRS